MPVVELYSQRRRREAGEVSDVLQYDDMPPALRQQSLYIVQDLFGPFYEPYNQEDYRYIVRTLRRELGVQTLVDRPHELPALELEKYVLRCGSEGALDAIELCLRYAFRRFTSEMESRSPSRFKHFAKEFNERCRTAGFGYSFEGGALIRVDSQFLHRDAVMPALTVLSESAFSGANAEFRQAHDHWRAGRLSEVLVDCLKAFESTIKIIAAERGWSVPDRPTASQLVQAIFDNQFLPGFYQNQLGGLRSLLESGIPTPRNRMAGHGAGTVPQQVPTELVRYVLHLTAATILYLVDTHRGR